jgi:hypothetical protein
MDGLTLLWDARAAGLTVHADGDYLIIRGPRSAAALAHRLLARKPDILAALAMEAADPSTAHLCPDCHRQGTKTAIPRHWRQCRPCVLASLPRCRLCGERPVGPGGYWCVECQIADQHGGAEV